jgi:hypothetical protein
LLQGGTDTDIPSLSFRKAQLNPLLAFVLFGEGGLDKNALEQFKITKRQFKALPKTERGKLFGQFFRIPRNTEVETILQDRQTRARESFNKSFKSLFGEEGPPALQAIAAEAGGSLRRRFAPNVAQLLQEAIGSRAGAGTLTTDQVLQNAGAGVGLAAEQFFQGSETNARAQQLAIAGIPGLTSTVANVARPRESVGGIRQTLFNANSLGLQRAALEFQQDKFNTLLRQQQFGQLQGFGSGILGGAQQQNQFNSLLDLLNQNNTPGDAGPPGSVG